LIEPMALNIDLCPTFLDLAGIEVPRGVEGRSWRPILGGARPRGWRAEFLYEYFRDAEAKKRPAIRAVRTTRWKYITYPEGGGTPELYDLAQDPLEMRNLAQDSAYGRVVAEMKSRLDRF